jgi:2-polyprenyl-3-methyl-5-hydroxy-6-metoxy-1,4-benzoquinol methylase
MRNLLDEKPTLELHGRLKYTVAFVDDEDLRQKRVLDIGCGFGWFELSALARGAAEVVGTEISETDLRTIKRHLQDSRLSTRVASALELPFDDRHFDTVVSWEVLEHIPRNTEPRMFVEVARVLKPGGRFYVSTPHAALLSQLADPAWWLLGHRHYTAKRLYTLAKAASFAVERLEIRGGFWEVTSLLNLYFSKWILRRRPLAEKALTARIDREYETPGFGGLYAKLTKAQQNDGP